MVTIRDVAKRAGVSTATVSYVLNDTPNQMISPETVLKVLQACEELGYSANVFGRALSTGKSNNIGLFLVSAHGGLYGGTRAGDIMVGVNKAISSTGYSIVTEILESTDTVLNSCITRFRSKLIEGAVVVGAMKKSVRVPETVFKYPMVLVDVPGHERISYVSLDEKDAVVKSVNHLANKGCERIALITGGSDFLYYSVIVAAFEAAIKENKLQYDETMIVPSLVKEKSGYDAIQLLMNRPDKPDGIVVSAASMAITVGVLAGVSKYIGVMSRPLKIVAYSESRVARYLKDIGEELGIDFTLLEYDLEHVGQIAGEKLLGLLEGDKEASVALVKGNLV